MYLPYSLTHRCCVEDYYPNWNNYNFTVFQRIAQFIVFFSLYFFQTISFAVFSLVQWTLHDNYYNKKNCTRWVLSYTKHNNELFRLLIVYLINMLLMYLVLLLMRGSLYRLTILKGEVSECTILFTLRNWINLKRSVFVDIHELLITALKIKISQYFIFNLQIIYRFM